MAVWDNFVQVQTNTSMSVAAVVVDIDAPVNGWRAPPDPAGDLAYVTLTDDLVNPTYFEIISYTGRTGVGPYVLTGVTRALEGTSARIWPIGTYVLQYLTAAEAVDEHELSSQAGDVEINGGTF